VVNGLRRTTRVFTCRSTQTVDHDTKPRLARKYQPVVRVFEDEMDRMRLPVAPESLAAIAAQLATTRERLEHIMEKY